MCFLQAVFQPDCNFSAQRYKKNFNHHKEVEKNRHFGHFILLFAVFYILFPIFAAQKYHLNLF
jgi:hypothetical protein